MSSTNRSDARQEHIADYYVTPQQKILEFLNEFEKHENLNRNIKILDPTSGGDKCHLMSYPEVLQNKGFFNIDTIDIRKDSLAAIKGNYLELDCKNKYDMIITNPPFNISLDIINKALDDIKENGFVIMLLRLNYFGGKIRQSLWKTHMPKYSFVHNRRISFTDDGKTDSIEYQHLVFQKGCNPEFTMLKII